MVLLLALDAVYHVPGRICNCFTGGDPHDKENPRGRRRHWRRRPGLHSIHAQYEDDGCRRLSGPAAGPGGGWVPDRPPGGPRRGRGGGLPAASATLSPLPLVADIHFDYRLAIAAAEAGAAKMRINPGNIGGEDRVQRRGRTAAGCITSPSASASTAAAWSAVCWKNTATSRRRLWSRARFPIWRCWKNSGFMIRAFP